MQNNDNYSIGEDFNIEVMQYYKYRATKVKPKKKNEFRTYLHDEGLTLEKFPFAAYSIIRIDSLYRSDQRY